MAQVVRLLWCLSLALGICAAIRPQAAESERRVGSGLGQVFSVSDERGVEVTCRRSGSKLHSGSMSRRGKFTTFAAELSAVSQQIRKAKGAKKRTLQRRKNVLRANMRSWGLLCLNEDLRLRCAPRLLDQRFDVAALQPKVLVPVVTRQQSSASCAALGNLEYRVVTSPQLGTVTTDSGGIAYQSTVVRGLDDFTIAACFEDTTICSDPAIFSVQVSVPCELTLSSQTIGVESFSNAVLDLAATSPQSPECALSGGVRFELVGGPAHGVASIAGTAVTYSAQRAEGNDQISVRVCEQNSSVCGDPVAIQFQVEIPPRCTPVLQSQSFSLSENGTLQEPLAVIAPCSGFSLAYAVTSPPSAGTAAINADGVISYHGGFVTGAQSFGVQVCLEGYNRCSDEGTVLVSIAADDFVGRSQELAPYRDRISAREAAYLLKKVAFTGCEQLVALGVTQGLTALVDALLDDQDATCRVTLPIPSDATNTDPNRFSYHYYNPTSGGYEFNHWRMDLLHRISFTNARYNAPLREYMTWIVWHNHFATNAWENSLTPKHHYNILWRNALGNFGDFFRDFYGRAPAPTSPSEYITPGVDPTLSFHPDYQQLNGSPLFATGGATAAFGNWSYQVFLNNDINTFSAPNENLGRELLELHLAGSIDPITHLPNYSQEDVRASANALSGYEATFSNGDNGVFRAWLKFNPARAMAGAPGSSITFFQDTPYETTGSFSSNFEPLAGQIDYIPFLMNDWAPVSRNIGAKLFTQLAHSQLSEGIVSELSANLLTWHQDEQGQMKNYDIKRALRTIMRSEAMFSKDAVGTGVQSPVETFVGMVRTANLPVTNWNHGFQLMQASIEAQQQLLAPPNVFGWRSFGVMRQGVVLSGEDWLHISPLLGTIRGIFRIANATLRVEWSGHITRSFLPNGNATTAPQLVDAMLTKFRFTLPGASTTARISEEERQILIEYVQESADAPGVWNPVSDATVKRKVAGLLVLLASHPQFLRKG